MPFRLKNTLDTFQRMINSIFADLINKICFICLDNIIIFLSTYEEHLLNLKKVFECIHKHSLQIMQPDKSEFIQKEIMCT